MTIDSVGSSAEYAMNAPLRRYSVTLCRRWWPLFGHRFQHFDKQLFHVDGAVAVDVQPEFPDNLLGLPDRWQDQQEALLLGHGSVLPVA